MEATGIARARDVSNGRDMSPEVIDEMAAWFERHEIDKQGETWRDQGKGWQAWNGWGGDAGRTWANKVQRQMDRLDAEAKQRAMSEATQTVFGPDMRLAELGEGDRRWIHIFAWGPVKHPEGKFVVDRDFADSMLESFEKLAAHGYRPPVLEEHRANGQARGLIHGLEVRESGIWADVETSAGVAAEIDRGERPHVSPAFFPKFKHPHTGEELTNVLRELSFVSIPHLKNLTPLGLGHYRLGEHGFIHQSLPEETMTTARQATPGVVENEEHDGEKSMMQKLMDKVEAMENKLGAMESMEKRMKQLEESMTPKGNADHDDDDKEMKDKRMSESNARLAEQVDVLTAELADMKVRADVATRLGEVDDATMVALTEAHAAAPAAYELTVSALAKARDAARVDLSERGSAGITGSMVASKSIGFEEACVKLNEQGRLPKHKHFGRLMEITGLGAQDLDERWDEDTYKRIVG